MKQALDIIIRLDCSINEWRGLLHEAWSRRDALAVWEAQAHIKHLEAERDRIKEHAEKLTVSQTLSDPRCQPSEINNVPIVGDGVICAPWTAVGGFNFMSEKGNLWPDCKEVQCAQAHELARVVLDILGEECPDDIYIVGKAIRISEAINRLKSNSNPKPISSDEFVKYWDSLNFEQHCLLAAQSLLRAASLVKRD